MAGRGPGSTCWVTPAARVSPRPDPRAPASAGSSGAGMTAAPPARAAAVARRRGEEEEKRGGGREEEEQPRSAKTPAGGRAARRGHRALPGPGTLRVEPTIRGSLKRGPCRGPRRPLRPREPPTSGTHPRGVEEEGGALMRPEVAPPSEGLGVHPGHWLSHCPLPAAVGSPAPANYCPAPGWGRRGGGGGCLAERGACKGGPLEGSVGWKAEGGGCWNELRSGVLVLLVAGLKCPAGRRDGGQQACHLPPPP